MSAQNFTREQVKRAVVSCLVKNHFVEMKDRMLYEGNDWIKDAGITSDAEVDCLLQEMIYEATPSEFENLLK